MMATDPLEPSTCLSTTAALVERAQLGDREAFGLLIERFQPTVFALARRRLGHASEAAELTQDVFLHAMRRLGQLREPERFAGWLKQMTIRLAINRATRRVPPPSVERAVLESRAGESTEPFQELMARERATGVWQGLGQLAPVDRETLVAFYIHGLSIIEVAERHEVPVGTVKRRLHTARKRLKLVLEQDGSDWSNNQSRRDDTARREPIARERARSRSTARRRELAYA